MENVIIRKPTDDEQRNGKIITSDYLISALTIHSSVLKTLGFIDKVYRSKQSIVVPSNKKLLMKYSKNLNYLMRTFGYTKTPINFNEFRTEIKNNKDFIKHLIDNKVATWSQIGGKEKLPKIARKYHTATTFIRAVEAIELFFDMFNEDGLEDIIYAKTSSEPLQKIAPHIKEVLNSNIRPSVYKHSQTIVWQKALAKQKEIEKELGKNFTPKKYAEFYLSADTLDLISYYWKLDLLNYDGSWSDLCNYLYSPEIISIIRNNLNVNVRARSTFDTRKGVETSDKKKFVKLIEVQKKILGENFNKEDEELKIAELENKLILYKAKYNEAKLLKKYSDKEDREFAIKEVEKYKNKYYYYKTAVTKAKQLFDKKVKAHCNLETYTAKHNLIKEIIEETRSGEEISMLEREEQEAAIRKQKAEENIPYYTWRFVCDKIDINTAQTIEKVLEDNLNKGSGINGEDGYINVTAFPMSKSFEFFVDYPKNSNLFKAFKNKGIELSNILIEGIASHIKKSFVNCQGETYFNNPMAKTLNGDMLDWIGV